MDFNPQNIDLQFIVEDTFSVLAANAQNKKVQLISQIPAKTIAFADANMATTVVRNLISNALKFTNELGKIVVNSRYISDNQNNSTSKKIEVCVLDTGIGIAKDDIYKLFKIDESLKTNGTAGEQGTGLGLILCHEFVERNGGNIWVESEEGKGSQFYFTLPVA